MAFTEPNWAELWRELVERWQQYNEAHADPERQARYLRRLKRSPKAVPSADPLVDFVASQLTPNSTVLDIGAGAGRWAVRLAAVASQVTAIEPSAQLCAALSSHAEQAGLQNVQVLQSTWEDCHVEPHDVVLNSHAMYGCVDLVALVRSMERCARRACFLTMRSVPRDGVMAELSRRLRGHPHDSPNFEIGYNVLLGLGIGAEVVMDRRVRCWHDDDLEAALGRAKRHLYLAPDDHSFDDQVRAVLKERLVPADGRLRWPDGVRSALMWWPVA